MPRRPTAPPSSPRALTDLLTSWFRAHARPFPWRAPSSDPSLRRDPYHVLVSEFMLQQTQTSRVAERFPRFLARFPTPAALAAADESEVLAEWSGLGYYRRAKLLHAAAKAIATHHAGHIPSDPTTLRTLPGVGPYTAGAIASIAFNLSAPLVDGNVARVLLRLQGQPLPPTAPATQRHLWHHAETLVQAAKDPGDFNEALMELGATTCTPKNPACDRCPWRAHCQAAKDGTQHEIPAPKPRAKQTPLYAAAVLVEDAEGRVLIEQRPPKGLWAGLWQPPTLERDDRPPTREEIEQALGVKGLKELDRFTHATTHRMVYFTVYEADMADLHNRRIYTENEKVKSRALGTPQRRILLTK